MGSWLELLFSRARKLLHSENFIELTIGCLLYSFNAKTVYTKNLMTQNDCILIIFEMISTRQFRQHYYPGQSGRQGTLCPHNTPHFFKKKNVQKSWGCPKIISLLHEVANYRIACAQNPLLSKIK